MSVKYYLPGDAVAVASKLPHGRSRNVEWPGGTAVLKIAGTFSLAAGVGTVVALNSASRRLTDGVLSAAVPIGEYREPGEYQLNIPPGQFFFQTSGPSSAPWSVEVRVESAPKAAKQPSLDERVKALEQGRAGESVSSTAVH